MFATTWEAVAARIKASFSISSSPMNPQSRIVATVVSLDDFKKAFLGTSNFLSLPCWKSLTHVVVRDFLNISTAGNEVCVAGSANRFGWVVYKNLLRKLLETHTHLTLLIEFHELIGRDIMYGSRRFPCCDMENFLNDNFPTGKVGLCMHVLNYMSILNLESGLGAALQCLSANMGTRFSVWADIENQHFHLTDTQFAFFDGAFMYRNPRLTVEQKKRVVVKVEKPFIDAKIAYINYAGMMTMPIFKDGSDAAILPFDKARLDKLANPSMLNTCLKEWHSLAQQHLHAPCPKCALPRSVCVAQSNAPGSCSKQRAQPESPSSVCSSSDGLFEIDL